MATRPVLTRALTHAALPIRDHSVIRNAKTTITTSRALSRPRQVPSERGECRRAPTRHGQLGEFSLADQPMAWRTANGTAQRRFRGVPLPFARRTSLCCLEELLRRGGRQRPRCRGGGVTPRFIPSQRERRVALRRQRRTLAVRCAGRELEQGAAVRLARHADGRAVSPAGRLNRGETDATAGYFARALAGRDAVGEQGTHEIFLAARGQPQLRGLVADAFPVDATLVVPNLNDQRARRSCANGVRSAASCTHTRPL